MRHPMLEYELHSRKRMESFWSKEPSSNSFSEHHAFSTDYSFENTSPYAQSTGTVNLSFLEFWRNTTGSGLYGPVVTVNFTESQLVEFIIEAEKALQSIQGK